jgi:hypothetical protein
MLSLHPSYPSHSSIFPSKMYTDSFISLSLNSLPLPLYIIYTSHVSVNVCMYVAVHTQYNSAWTFVVILSPYVLFFSFFVISKLIAHCCVLCYNTVLCFIACMLIEHIGLHVMLYCCCMLSHLLHCILSRFGLKYCRKMCVVLLLSHSLCMGVYMSIINSDCCSILTGSFC